MITLRFTQPGHKFQGIYSLPAHMLDEARAFLVARGYVVEEGR